MMTHCATVLDGKAVSKTVLASLAEEITHLKGRHPPKLAAVLVGENPASEIYVSRKMKVAQQVGILSELHRFPEATAEAELREHLATLNGAPDVHAILVQLPLPRQIRPQAILETVCAHKDVDGFHPENLGRLLMGLDPMAVPCTPAGIIRLLEAYDISFAGKHAVVVGRSNIVGKPVALLMLQRHATVTLCHSQTPDLAHYLRQADIVVAAAGQAGLVTAEAIQPGAVVVDVGINRLPEGRLVGDIDYEAIARKAGYVTPVPGGVGPMTIAMLMVNTVRLFQHQQAS